MTNKNKAIINEAYVAYMHSTATEEQELLLELANTINLARIKLEKQDYKGAREFLYENDFTVGTN